LFADLVVAPFDLGGDNFLIAAWMVMSAKSVLQDGFAATNRANCM
jgi:hypothetical protein